MLVFKAAPLLGLMLGLLSSNRFPLGKVAPPRAGVPPHWSYQRLDSTRTVYDGQDGRSTKKWFGMAVGDVTGDGYADVMAGKWLYVNPAGQRGKPWPRTALGDSLDVLGVADANADGRPDVLAAACNRQGYFSRRPGSSAWTFTVLTRLPICNHKISSQGYAVAELFPGRPHWLMTSEAGDVFAIPLGTPAPVPVRLAQVPGYDKGVAVGRVDADGWADVVCGKREASGWSVVWLKNPGTLRADWSGQPVGPCTNKPDRLAVADLNADGRPDVVVSEGRWPGQEPDAGLYWFEQQRDGSFTRHTLVTQYSMNSLSVADLDGDGDLDLIVGEHKGPLLRLQAWLNRGRGRFEPVEIDRGKEHHLGALLADFDHDGKLDIASSGWDHHADVHLWWRD